MLKKIEPFVTNGSDDGIDDGPNRSCQFDNDGRTSIRRTNPRHELDGACDGVQVWVYIKGNDISTLQIVISTLIRKVCH